MTELTDFLTKLNNSDLIVLPIVSKDRIYYHFFLNSLYKIRMYIADPLPIAEINPLCGEGEEIDATGVGKLKQIFLAV